MTCENVVPLIYLIISVKFHQIFIQYRSEFVQSVVVSMFSNGCHIGSRILIIFANLKALGAWMFHLKLESLVLSFWRSRLNLFKDFSIFC